MSAEVKTHKNTHKKPSIGQEAEINRLNIRVDVIERKVLLMLRVPKSPLK